MSLTTSEMTPADFAAVTGNNDGFGNGDGWWIILFLILAMGGNWGNGFGGGGNGGGTGGTKSWWTDELRKQYSEKNVMKSENQRQRMKKNNPMSKPEIAEKTNGQKRRKVTIGNITYNSIKEAKDTLGISYSNIITWSKKGKTPNGEVCLIEPQKQHWGKNNMQGNQQPSRGNVDKSTTEGSTTNG